MKERRLIKIENKIFEKKDIINLANKFYSEYNKSQKRKQRSSVNYTISCDDNTTYESEALDLFEDGNIIDLKRAISIEMSFYHYDLDRRMNISLVHGMGFRDNVIIQGCDKNWVSSVFTELDEIIKSVKPQKNLLLEHKTFLLNLLSLGIGVSIYSVLHFLTNRYTEPIKNPSENMKAIAAFLNSNSVFRLLFNWLLLWLMGIILATSIRAWLLNSWPSIEFDFGPEHMKIEKQRRVRIAVVLSMAIIPTAIAIIYDSIKYFLFK